MERTKSIKGNRIIAAIYIIFAAGIIGHSIPAIKPLMLSITPLALLIAGTLAIYEPAKKNNQLIIWGILTYFITLSLEAIGTNTGMIFGSYRYESTLGVKIMNVPYVIGFNWVVLILGAVSLASLLSNNTAARLFISSGLTVGVDIFLEKLAGKLDYWSWTGNIVPFYNYVTWFIISLIAAASLILFVKNFYHKNLVHYFIGQSIFIIISDLIIK